MMTEPDPRSSMKVAPSVSVVIPVFNGSATLPALVTRLSAILPGIASVFEIILVNDGSRDESWKVIEDLSEKHDFVRGIDLMRNYGQHNALLCGIRAAHHGVIVTMDDDLQNPPEEISKLLDKLQEGYDVVYGTPQVERHGFLRDLASRFTKLALQKSMGVKAARNVSAFRAFMTRAREGFADYRGPFVSIDVLLTWGASRFASVKVRHEARPEGKSNYTLGMLVRHAFNMITGFSTLPLQVASILGFALTVFGLGVFAYVIGRYLLEGSSVPGFPFLASIIAIFSGAQLFAIGIIGEYLARMHFRMMDRPAYVVQRRIAQDGQETIA